MALLSEASIGALFLKAEMMKNKEEIEKVNQTARLTWEAIETFQKSMKCKDFYRALKMIRIQPKISTRPDIHLSLCVHHLAKMATWQEMSIGLPFLPLQDAIFFVKYIVKKELQTMTTEDFYSFICASVSHPGRKYLTQMLLAETLAFHEKDDVLTKYKKVDLSSMLIDRNDSILIERRREGLNICRLLEKYAITKASHLVEELLKLNITPLERKILKMPSNDLLEEVRLQQKNTHQEDIIAQKRLDILTKILHQR